MPIEVHGLNEFQNELRRLMKNLKELGGEHAVPLQEIFPPAFMHKHTDFDTIDAMLDASGFKIQTSDDFAAIPDSEWDAFVASRTRFNNWKRMLDTAIDEWVAGKLDSE